MKSLPAALVASACACALAVILASTWRDSKPHAMSVAAAPVKAGQTTFADAGSFNSNEPGIAPASLALLARRDRERPLRTDSLSIGSAAGDSLPLLADPNSPPTVPDAAVTPLLPLPSLRRTP